MGWVYRKSHIRREPLKGSWAQDIRRIPMNSVTPRLRSLGGALLDLHLELSILFHKFFGSNYKRKLDINRTD